MTDSNILNSIGLVMDIAGAIILFYYGLPSDLNPTGAILIAADEDPEEARLYQVYKFRSRIGLALLILGFISQLVSNFL